MRNTRTLTPFGRSVKIRLIEEGMTHAELCARTGCGITHLSDIMTGRRSGIKYLEKICAELHLPYGTEPVDKGA